MFVMSVWMEVDRCLDGDLDIDIKNEIDIKEEETEDLEADPSTWQHNINKNLRAFGKEAEYLDIDIDITDENDIIKEEETEELELQPKSIDITDENDKEEETEELELPPKIIDITDENDKEEETEELELPPKSNDTKDKKEETEELELPPKSIDVTGENDKEEETEELELPPKSNDTKDKNDKEEETEELELQPKSNDTKDKNDKEEETEEFELPPKRRRIADPSTWQQNINKKLRALGKEYTGKKYDYNCNTWMFVKKTERKQRKLCRKNTCARTNNKFCNDFTDNDCKRIFEEYWSTGNKNMQNTFIYTYVSVKEKVQTTVLGESRRQCTRIFRLKKDNKSLQVCKEMFMNTLGISNYKVEAVLKSNQVEITKQIARPRNPTPSRGFRWSLQDQEFLGEFFNMIPKTTGHYCHRDSSKIYLSIIIPTWKKLHDIYQARCHAFGKEAFSIAKFTRYINDKNYSLFKRKKDLCNICLSHEEGIVSTEEFNLHQAKKEEALNLKRQDIESAANDCTKAVITAGTESLLMAPLNDANIMFFHTKLNLHNFTFCNLVTKDVINFVWSEINGDLKSSSFTTIYIDYLTRLIEKSAGITTIIIWSDGCNYQNRCHILSSALVSFAVKNCVEVYHKYMEVGHTHIECDSVHSNIEKSKKNVKINLPTDYINIIQSSRKGPSPYGVRYLDYTFFKNYESISDLKTVKPSKEVGSPNVGDIRQFKYTPDKMIYFNLTYNDNVWEILPHTFKLRFLQPQLIRLSPIKISYAKYQHLQEIKITIPRECHAFYDNLEHSPKPQI